ncbi:hypothetical protein FF38_10259 [Lucilia cuprina]|uniref:Uncharacterized protein n=1 Tax=Lucilia cuprina TaxID=7375 RepID=A0A0L0BYW9_LUCCU|nr:hypothetical protein FF38_10259 [Lucilia cuprina]
MPEGRSQRYQRDVEEIEFESDEEDEELQGVGVRVQPSSSRRPSTARDYQRENRYYYDDDEEVDDDELDDEVELEVSDFEE